MSVNVSVSEAIGSPVPFAELLGIEVTRRENGSARVELSLRPELLNSWSAAHGGVVMTLADVALAVAARTMDASANGAITVAMSLTFIGAGQDRLVADARCLRYGTSLAFCEGEIRDVKGALVAKAMGTFKMRRAKKPER
jgi:uncharacterized protein (TIGR00369 family)